MVLSDIDIIREINAGNITVEPAISILDISPSSLDVHLGNQISKVTEIHPAIHRVIDISHPVINTIFEVTLPLLIGHCELEFSRFY